MSALKDFRKELQAGYQKLQVAADALGDGGPKAIDDKISIELPRTGTTVQNWKSAEVGNSFTDSSSSWSVEVADDNVMELMDKVQNRAPVVVRVNGIIQATGYVDQIHPSFSRGAASQLSLNGRDALSPAIDAHMDPAYSFAAQHTLKEVMETLFKQFGFTVISIDDSIARAKIANTTERLLTDEKRNFIEKQLTTAINSKFKPQKGEGYVEFAERLGRRFGFHVWASADGKTLFIGRPNSTQPALYSLQNKRNQPESESNNILSGDATYDIASQPSVIVAEGHGGGGHFRKDSLKVIMVNELVSDALENKIRFGSEDTPATKAIKARYKKALIIPRRTSLKVPERVDTLTADNPLYAYDDESKTQDHLKNYVRRRMAEFQSKFLVVRYTVARFNQAGVMWTPNTIVNVDDDDLDIHGPMWIQARTFKVDRSGGTTTTLTCILPGTYDLFEGTE